MEKTQVLNPGQVPRCHHYLGQNVLPRLAPTTVLPSNNYVLPTTWSYTKMNLLKNFSAILAGSIKQNKSAQPAYFQFGIKASWADLFHLFEPTKMAKKFGRFILV